MYGPKIDRFLGKTIEKASSWVWRKFIHNLEFGLMPKEYNFKVHGVYVPWRYYGKCKYILYIYK